jgi:hypothetical protein
MIVSSKTTQSIPKMKVLMSHEKMNQNRAMELGFFCNAGNNSEMETWFHSQAEMFLPEDPVSKQIVLRRRRNSLFQKIQLA